MAELASKHRNALPSSSFGLPEERKYPMPDKEHAAKAKGRATQQLHKGNPSAAEKARIDRKANAILGNAFTAKPKKKV